MDLSVDVLEPGRALTLCPFASPDVTPFPPGMTKLLKGLRFSVLDIAPEKGLYRRLPPGEGPLAGRSAEPGIILVF
jgi:hypothetical protein